MFDFEELLAVAYKKERMLSRRLARGASMSEHDALIHTLTKAAGAQSLRDLVDARRAQQAKSADALRERRALREARRFNRPSPRETSDQDAWIGWFDGSALPNPGRIGMGAMLKSPRGATFEISAQAGRGDSSAAEYLALIALLETALREGAHTLRIFGDSRVVIDDLHASHDAGIRSLVHHAERARVLIAQIGDVRLQWIPRARNAAADALSRRALLSSDEAAQSAA